MSQNLIDTKKSKLLAIWRNEEIEILNLNGYVKNNALLGNFVKEIIKITHKEEIRVWGRIILCNIKMLNKIPSCMSIKILSVRSYDGMKVVHDKIKAEFNLKVFDDTRITEEVVLRLNSPTKV